jgi:signal transduction histidine kinase
MKADQDSWSQRYQTALRRYLMRRETAGLRAALRLGHQAVALGLETLDVALIHELALTHMVPLDDATKHRDRLAEHAKRFFSETIVPIEKKHDAALKATARVSQLTQTLHKRAKESAASARDLEKSILRRQTAEAALVKSGKDRAKLEQKSKRLHTLLRDQTREILLSQEATRHKTSLQLQDDVAQALLAINIRLLSLKKSALVNTEKFASEIAETQQLVKESISKVNGVHL